MYKKYTNFHNDKILLMDRITIQWPLQQPYTKRKRNAGKTRGKLGPMLQQAIIKHAWQ